jgi:hypothetical protein
MGGTIAVATLHTARRQATSRLVAQLGGAVSSPSGCRSVRGRGEHRRVDGNGRTTGLRTRRRRRPRRATRNADGAGHSDLAGSPSVTKWQVTWSRRVSSSRATGVSLAQQLRAAELRQAGPRAHRERTRRTELDSCCLGRVATGRVHPTALVGAGPGCSARALHSRLAARSRLPQSPQLDARRAIAPSDVLLAQSRQRAAIMTREQTASAVRVHVRYSCAAPGAHVLRS